MQILYLDNELYEINKIRGFSGQSCWYVEYLNYF